MKYFKVKSQIYLKARTCRHCGTTLSDGECPNEHCFLYATKQ